WLGEVSDDELARLYRGARCLVYASLYEGFGLPVAEALACGCPVVTSAGSAMAEVAGDDAVYVDPTDVASIRDGIGRAFPPLPRLLRRLRPELAHFQHALPLGWAGRSVVTLHDLSFETDPVAMGRLDRLVFRTFVPRAARRADHVLVVSERTRRDVEERYGIPPGKVTVTPNGVDPSFTPGGSGGAYLLFVGAIQRRKDPLAALEAAR